ncbi:MAG: alpha/beta hydrolase [Gammaproteobacteria bacterium]|nr:alpha/beta hydrolase [Gammaproteobacteria bacterium]
MNISELKKLSAKQFLILMSGGAILLTLAASNVSAQNQKVRIWPELAPGSENTANNEKWEGLKKVTGVYQPDLTYFPLQQSAEKSSALLIFPGGGYKQLEFEKEGIKIAKWANQNGVTAFVLKYRLNEQLALRDAQRAMSFLRANANKYHIDKNRIGVIGFSAGAHLAANLTLNANNRNKVDAIDNESSRPDFFIGIYSGYSGIFGPLGRFKVTSDFAPAFLVHAANDDKADIFGSLELYAVLNRMNIPAELHLYEHGGHGFALETDRGDAITSTVNAWSRRCIEWLKLREVI